MGRLSDRFGREKVLLGSQIGAVLSLALLGSAQTVIGAAAVRASRRGHGRDAVTRRGHGHRHPVIAGPIIGFVVLVAVGGAVIARSRLRPRTA